MSTTTPEMSTMNHYVALVADATGKYAHVYGKHATWGEFIDELEDGGCEVIEEQTEDFGTHTEISFNELASLGVCTLKELIDAPGFTPFA